jgi:putative transposase
MYKAYKYRIYPTAEQKQRIDQTLGVCRFVYNLALETKIRAWQSAQKNLSAFDLINQLPELKQVCSWITEVDSQAVQAAIKKVENSFKGFFSGKGFPKFKNKKGRHSFQCPNNTRKIDWNKSTLTIPKIKDIPIVLTRKFDGKIKTVTISKITSGKYFASILVDNDNEVPKKPAIIPETTTGIDIGIKSFAVTSHGLSFEANRYLKKNLQRLKCLQYRSSRKKKGSNNRKKANKCVAILHERIANQRADYIHKITTSFVRDSQTDTFMIEDLNVAGMVKNGKLSRSIQDASFGEFFRQMKYKCEWYGKNLIVIDRFAPSSKRCSDCGEINQDLTLADREWTCVCGSHHDRDLNAAKNIKHFGLQQVLNNSPVGSRGGPVESRRIRRAKKQEPMPNLL